MKKNGFTLIELIAVVVIMAIIALIATPNIVSMLDKGKKEDYVADAKEFISKATYMYKQSRYKNDGTLFSKTSNSYKILITNIEGVNDLNDPYGGTYDQNSYVKFVEPAGNELGTRQIYIYLKSCDSSNSNCHYIGSSSSPVLEDSLSVDSVIEDS